MKRAALVCYIDAVNEQTGQPNGFNNGYMCGSIHDEGDAERLLTRHLDQFGDRHRGYCTIVVEGTPLWDSVNPDAALGEEDHPDDPLVGEIAVSDEAIDALMASPNPYATSDRLRDLAHIQQQGGLHA